jgi:hypothetical protein
MGVVLLLCVLQKTHPPSGPDDDLCYVCSLVPHCCTHNAALQCSVTLNRVVLLFVLQKTHPPSGPDDDEHEGGGDPDSANSNAAAARHRLQRPDVRMSSKRRSQQVVIA